MEDFDLQTVVSRVLQDNGCLDSSRTLGISDFVRKTGVTFLKTFLKFEKNKKLVAQLKTYVSNEPKNKKKHLKGKT